MCQCASMSNVCSHGICSQGKGSGVCDRDYKLRCGTVIYGECKSAGGLVMLAWRCVQWQGEPGLPKAEEEMIEI